MSFLKVKKDQEKSSIFFKKTNLSLSLSYPLQTGQRQTPNPLQHSQLRVLLATREAAAASRAAPRAARKRSFFFFWFEVC